MLFLTIFITFNNLHYSHYIVPIRLSIPGPGENKIEFQVGYSASKAINPDYRPQNSSDPAIEEIVNLVGVCSLNQAGDGMISCVHPGSYTEITVRTTYSGISHHNFGVNKTTKIYRDKPAFRFKGNTDPITREILFSSQYRFPLVNLNVLPPPYIKQPAGTITNNDSFYMTSWHRFYESKIRGFDEIETMTHIAINDFTALDPPEFGNGWSLDPRVINMPAQCHFGPYYTVPKIFDMKTMTEKDPNYPFPRARISSKVYLKEICPITASFHSLTQHIAYLEEMAHIMNTHYYSNTILMNYDSSANSVTDPTGSHVYSAGDDLKEEDDTKNDEDIKADDDAADSDEDDKDQATKPKIKEEFPSNNQRNIVLSSLLAQQYVVACCIAVNT